MSLKKSKKKKHEDEDLIEYESSSGVSFYVDIAKIEDNILATASEGFSSQMGFIDYADILGTEEIQTVKIYDTTAISQDMTELMSVVHRTEGKVNETMAMVKKITEKLDVDSDENSGEVQSTLDIDDDTAERMIIEYLQQNETVFPSDLADALNIDIDQIARVLQKLGHEGVIGTDE